MNTNYPKDKSKEFIWYIWKIMEDMQDEYPYYFFGWDGFNLIIWFL